MLRKPAFWTAFTVAAAACAAFAILNFPRAFSIVDLDVAMDREAALSEARRLSDEFGWGPSGYRQAASFRSDRRAQSFVELEGGGADAFAALLRDGPHHPWQWVVRHFRGGEVRETEVRFRPDGAPYGFRERLPEDAPGAALDAARARALAERGARGAPWNVALGAWEPVESSQQERPGGRLDHTFVYERPDARAGEGRFRLRLVVSGDRLTELTRLLRIPEAFDRRYEQMRSANDGISVGGAFAGALLYGVGGIGIGLFVLLRQRRVIWRMPLVWGGAIAGGQLLAGLNAWPLAWMEYDTAVSEFAFAAQQATGLVSGAVGFAVVCTLSIMAAENLSRRAFPQHVQFWRCWSRDGARSLQVLGQTAGGYLLVGVDLAFLVAFYWAATRCLGWWSPSDVMLNPDMLATVLPWFNPIAASLQAGFWEECLFRAVPLAGAALLGDRFGRRRAWIAAAFAAQIVIFGAGHASYPAQPAYARVVELIAPSTIFGLLYLRFGLLPAIVMHFVYDVALFGLPLFVSSAPGIWVDRSLFLAAVLAPVWVVLGAWLRGGRWIEAPAALRNGSWTPPPPNARTALDAAVQPTEADDSDGLRTAPDGLRASASAAAPHAPPELPRWPVTAAIAAVGFGLWGCLSAAPNDPPALEIGRGRALEAARAALAARGVDPAAWRESSAAGGGIGDEERFVWREAGTERYRALLGAYLPGPRWRVRYARFEGDVAARAEEHVVWVDASGAVTRQEHRLAEDAAGAALPESEARARAREALAGLAGGASRREDLREISAESSNLPNRTDWTFTFRDESVAGLAGGEARVEVTLAGGEVADARRFVHLPEDWRRSEEQRRTTLLIAFAVSSLAAALVVLAGATAAVIRWSRGRFHLGAGLAAGGVAAAASALALVNNLPTMLHTLSTAQPAPLQLGILVGGGLLGAGFAAALLGLLAGCTHVLAARPAGADRGRAAWAGLALGGGFLGSSALVDAAFGAAPPFWADYAPAGAAAPWLAAAADAAPRYLGFALVTLLVVTSVNLLTGGWTRRRAAGAAALLLAGLLLAPERASENLASWVVSGLVAGALLLAAHLRVLRVRPPVVVLAAAAITAPGLIAAGLDRAYDGALTGSLAGAAGVALLAWRWYGALTRPETEAAPR